MGHLLFSKRGLEFTSILDEAPERRGDGVEGFGVMTIRIIALLRDLLGPAS
jgi:hypothetical protein